MLETEAINHGYVSYIHIHFRTKRRDYAEFNEKPGRENDIAYEYLK